MKALALAATVSSVLAWTAIGAGCYAIWQKDKNVAVLEAKVKTQGQVITRQTRQLRGTVAIVGDVLDLQKRQNRNTRSLLGVVVTMDDRQPKP